MAMKFLSEEGNMFIVKVDDPKVARECYIQSLRISPYSVKGFSTTSTCPLSL